MPISLENIHRKIKDGRITRINQVFECATLKEWKAFLCAPYHLENLLQDARRFKRHHVMYLHIDTGIAVDVLWRLIEEQQRWNETIVTADKKGSRPL